MAELPDPRPRARTRAGAVFTRITAALTGLAIALTGALTAPEAHAASAWLDRIAIRTVFDGAQIPNPVDDSPSNGIVATGDAVAFQWDLGLRGPAGGSVAQTLPVGWSWDPASMGALDTDGEAYRAHHSISADGRTLTAAIERVGGKLLSVSGMKAIPTRQLENGATYVPKLIAVNGGAELEASADPITVRGEHRAEFDKTVAAHNIAGSYDFGDGAGAVEARAVDFVLRIRPVPEKEVGVLRFDLAQPAVIRDTFTVTGPQGASKLDFRAEIVRRTAGSVPTLQQDGNSITVTLAGYPSLPGAVADGDWNRATVAVRFWVRAADLPATGNNRVVVWNTATPQGWTTTGGAPVTVTPSSSKISGYVELPQAGIGVATTDKSILVQKDPSASPSLSGDPARLSGRYEQVDEEPVSTGSIIVPRWWVLPGKDRLTGGLAPIEDLVSYDFWNPDEQRILAGETPYVGTDRGETPLRASDYRVSYTSGIDRAAPERNDWVDTIEAAGGPSEVTGIRVAYTAGAWGEAAGTQSAFVVAVPMRLVSRVEDANLVSDLAAHAYTDSTGDSHFALDEAWIEVRDLRLQLGKRASRGTVVGGADIEYTLTPRLVANPGDPDRRPVRDLRIVDELPAGLVSVDTEDIPDDWRVERSGSAATGLTLTFTYAGEVFAGTELAPLAYTVRTSLLAPANISYVNTATLSATGANPDTAQASVTSIRAQVVGSEKRVAGDERIGPSGSPGWETGWFNLQTDSQGVSHFVDVLPYDGDGRGTSFTGEFRIADARITDGRGNPADEGYARLQYTVAPAAEVRAEPADSESIPWIEAAGVDLAAIGGISALRVVVADFAPGEDGFGGLAVTLRNPGHLDGDRYGNTVFGHLGASGRLGETNLAEVRIVHGDDSDNKDGEAESESDAEAGLDSDGGSGGDADMAAGAGAKAGPSGSADSSSEAGGSGAGGPGAGPTGSVQADASGAGETSQANANASDAGGEALARTGFSGGGPIWIAAAAALLLGAAILGARLRAKRPRRG